jgi:hypothetical protein
MTATAPSVCELNRSFLTLTLGGMGTRFQHSEVRMSWPKYAGLAVLALVTAGVVFMAVMHSYLPTPAAELFQSVAAAINGMAESIQRGL